MHSLLHSSCDTHTLAQQARALARTKTKQEEVVMRTSHSDGLDSALLTRSMNTRDSFQSSDDDTDIYPETDDEFYTSRWVNPQRVNTGRP